MVNFSIHLRCVLALSSGWWTRKTSAVDVDRHFCTLLPNMHLLQYYGSLAHRDTAKTPFLEGLLSSKLRIRGSSPRPPSLEKKIARSPRVEISLLDIVHSWENEGTVYVVAHELQGRRVSRNAALCIYKKKLKLMYLTLNIHEKSTTSQSIIPEQQSPVTSYPKRWPLKCRQAPLGLVLH
jgi:hypothetical protein